MSAGLYSVGTVSVAALDATAAAGGDVTISCSVGDASAAGVTASIAASNTVACSVGNAAADGVTASIVRTVTTTTGNASADGTTAGVVRSIPASVGNATADGITASILAAVTITCTVGDATADGVPATVTNTSASTAAGGYDDVRAKKRKKVLREVERLNKQLKSQEAVVEEIAEVAPVTKAFVKSVVQANPINSTIVGMDDDEEEEELMLLML